MISRNQARPSQPILRSTVKTAPAPMRRRALSSRSGARPSEPTESPRSRHAEREAQQRSLAQAAQDLELSREKYADLYDSAPVGYCTFDHVGCIQEINLTGAGLLGLERDHLIGRPFLAYVAREYRKKFLNHLWNCRHSQEPVITTEVELRGKDSIPLHVELLSMPIVGKQRHLAQFRTVITDGTTHLQTKTALRDTEQYRALFEQVAVGVAQTDSGGRFVRVNQRYCQIVGRSREELLTLQMQDITHPEDLPRNLEQFNQLSTEAPSFLIEKRYVRPDGSHVWVQNNVSITRTAPGKAIFPVAICQDITERKRAENRQALSYSIARILAESATIAQAMPNLLKAVCNHLDWDVGEFWLVDRRADVLRNAELWHRPEIAAGKFEKVSRRSTFGKGIGFPGQIWSSGKARSMPDICNDPVLSRERYAQKTGLHAAFGFPIRFNEDVLGVMVFFSREIRSLDPHPLEMFTALGSQIGQFLGRKRMEEALHQSEKQYRLLFESNPQPMWVHDGKTLAFLDVNAAAIEHYGYSREEFLRMTVKDIRPKEDVLAFPKATKEHREWKVGDAGVWRHRKKDGSLIDVEVTRSAIALDGRAAVLVLAQDVTARKRAERRRAVQYGVARILTESASIAEAAPKLLQTIGQGFGWDFGELWNIDREHSKMRRLACWHRPGVKLEGFERRTRQLSFPPQEGLMGQIAIHNRPLWFGDIRHHANFLRPALAANADLHAAFGFPIRTDETFWGAALFFHREIPQPDSDLMDTVTALNRQIIQFIQRRQAEKALRENEEELRRFSDRLEERVAKRTAELKRANEKLRAEIERRKRLEREVLEISDREQQRIGQDLHDELAPHLAGVAFLANTLQSRLEERALTESADAKRIVELLGQAVQQTRKLAWVVSPVTLEADGLSKALEKLASSIANIYNISCEFVCRQPVLIEGNVLATVNLYRIAQETVQNAIKHGKASVISIRLEEKRKTIHLTVQSDGERFPAVPPQGKGMGLKIMQNRAQAIRASFDISAGRNGGMVMTCCAPKSPDAEGEASDGHNAARAR